MSLYQREQMRYQPRWFSAGLLPIGVGALWLFLGWHSNLFCGLVACLPGMLMIATGAALLLWPGDRLITHNMALVAVVSLVLALVVAPWFGLFATLALLAGAAGVFLLAGFAAVVQNPVPAGVPWPRASLITAYKVAIDEMLLGWFVNCARIPRGESVDRDVAELETLIAAAESRDWPDRARALHQAPAAPVDIQQSPARAFGHDFEWLSFESGYTPAAGLPGGQRWLEHTANQRMHTRVFRHAGEPRPWLVCIHGYRMGVDAIDLSLFSIKRLHHKLGFNLLMPVLPLHGARRATRLTGGLFLDGPLADLLHAECQTLWDLRRCLAWLRATQDAAPSIGVLGYSLGGYNAALLAAYERDLACVIAGIPLADIPSALWRHMPGIHLRFMETKGIDPNALRPLLAPVSPLQLDCQVAFERRHIFAAAADQLVPPQQPLDLWRHWGQPPMHWFAGSHLSVRNETGVTRYVERVLRATDWATAG